MTSVKAWQVFAVMANGGLLIHPVKRSSPASMIASMIFTKGWLWSIMEEDEFDCEFEDDEYVQCISMAEGRARAMGDVVRELETFLKKIDC